MLSFTTVKVLGIHQTYLIPLKSILLRNFSSSNRNIYPSGRRITCLRPQKDLIFRSAVLYRIASVKEIDLGADSSATIMYSSLNSTYLKIQSGFVNIFRF